AITFAVGIIALLVLRDRPSATAPAPTARPSLQPLFRNRNIILLSFAGFAGLWGTWGFAFWANALLIRAHGFSPVETGFIVSLVGIAAIIGKPIIGWFSDWLGGRPKWLIVASYLLFA